MLFFPAEATGTERSDSKDELHGGFSTVTFQQDAGGDGAYGGEKPALFPDRFEPHKAVHYPITNTALRQKLGSLDELMHGLSGGEGQNADVGNWKQEG